MDVPAAPRLPVGRHTRASLGRHLCGPRQYPVARVSREGEGVSIAKWPCFSGVGRKRVQALGRQANTGATQVLLAAAAVVHVVGLGILVTRV